LRELTIVNIAEKVSNINSMFLNISNIVAPKIRMKIYTLEDLNPHS